MYYHILINTDETKDIYEIDKENLQDIIEYIIPSYMKNEGFQFDGYFIEPSKVKRLVITETAFASDYYYNKEVKELSASGVFYPIDKKYEVTQNDENCKNITRKVMQEVKETLKLTACENKKNDNSVIEENSTHNGKTIFLAYSYHPDDLEFVEGFKEFLEGQDFEVIDGQADRLGSISQAILEKINLSDIAVIVMTKRDKKENGKFTTSSWLLEEKGAAIAFNKRVAMLVEDGIDENDIGGMQGDDQRFNFTRNKFMKIAMNLVKIINK